MSVAITANVLEHLFIAGHCTKLIADELTELPSDVVATPIPSAHMRRWRPREVVPQLQISNAHHNLISGSQALVLRALRG